MEYRYLGPNAGLLTSKFILGTITFDGSNGMEHMGNVEADDGQRLFDIAMDHGINMIDTANMYSFGGSEKVVGEILKKDKKYNNLMITSKVRMVVENGPNGGGQSRWHILDQIEKTLGRLGRDHLDLYYLHEWDGVTSKEETLFTMDNLVRQGKIRYYGISNYTGWQLADTLAICEKNGFVKPVVQQIYYTPECRDAELDVIPAANYNGIGSHIWSPLGMGILTGKFSRDHQEVSGSRMTQSNWSGVWVRDRDRLWNLIDVLKKIASDKGVSVTQTTLAWEAARKGVSGIVIGARTPEQLIDSIGAPELTLNEDEIAAIDAVCPPTVLYPHWHQAQLANDRAGDAQSDILDITSKIIKNK